MVVIIHPDFIVHHYILQNPNVFIITAFTTILVFVKVFALTLVVLEFEVELSQRDPN